MILPIGNRTNNAYLDAILLRYRSSICLADRRMLVKLLIAVQTGRVA